MDLNVIASELLTSADKETNVTGSEMLTDADKAIHDRIMEFIGASEGYFSTRELFIDQNIQSRAAKNMVYQILGRMVKDGKLRRRPNRNGEYRRVVQEAEDLNWQASDEKKAVQLCWPFHLEQLVTLYPRNIAVVAGSPDAGKTALLLNLIYLNQHLHDVWLFNSEMGEVELKNRLLKFPCSVNDWNFHCKSRSSDFADVIMPDAVNLIDYWEISSDFSQIAQGFKEVFENLRNGVAIIALQKSKARRDSKGKEHQIDLGRGAEFSLEKPRLYLAMDSGRLKIVKGKNWTDPQNNPNGKEFCFKLVGGHEFIETENKNNAWWAD